MERTEYFLPPLGLVVAEFHHESERLYHGMTRTKEMGRLKSMPQLGIVPLAWEGARHTRWEYISLVLHITRVCKSDTRLSLNSRVVLPSGTTVSSAQELIQCWMLLLHLGHLQWTFTSEKLLMQQLRSSGEYGERHTEELLESVPAGRARDWAKGVLDGAEHYKFHQILAFYRLPRVPARNSERALWQEMLLAYVAPDQADAQSLVRTRALFKHIRRLAFLYLDAEYSPTALSLRLPRILNSPSEMERLLDPEHAGDQDELIGLERFLARNVYLAPDVLEATAQTYLPLRNLIRKRLESATLHEVVEQLASPKFALKDTARENRVTRVVRLEVEPRLAPFPLAGAPDLLDSQHHITRAATFAKSVEARIFVSHEVDAQGQLVIVQPHGLSGDLRSRVAALTYAFQFTSDLVLARERFTEIELDASQLEFFELYEQRVLIGDLASELLLAAMSEFFELEARWEWTRSVGDLRSVLTGRARLRPLVETLCLQTALSSPDRHEVHATIAATGGLGNAFYAASVSGLRAIGPDGRAAVEIDGVALSVDQSRSHLVLTIAEAKTQRRSATTAASKALRDKFSVLRRRSGVEQSPIRTGSLAGAAWRHFRAPIGKRS